MTGYSQLTVIKLKDELKARGLQVSGKKAELIQRLEENDQSTNTKEDEEVVAENEELEMVPEAAPVESTNIGPGEVATSSAVGGIAEELATKSAVPAQSTKSMIVDTESGNAAPIPVSALVGSIIEEVSEVTDKQRTDVIAEELAMEGTSSSQSIEPMAVDTKDMIAAPNMSSQTAVAVGDETTNPQPISKDMEDLEEKQEAISKTQADTEAIPAPELSVSQMPRPSIETQQTQNSQSFETDATIEKIARTDTLSTINTQELLEDSKKRKRRSHSPPVSTSEVALKKAKAVDGSPRATVVQNGQEILPASENIKENVEETERDTQQMPTESQKQHHDNRFKNFLPTQETIQEIEQIPEEKSIAPSRHAPTNCLYIGNLMRPLQPNALKTHLEKLAKPPSGDEQEEVGLFFLESTRRYGLASFSTASAASRARSGLHERVWPDESNRKALFVDFIPEAKANELIQTEEDNANKPRLERKRFEVMYVEHDGETVAEIHDSDSPTALQHRGGQETGTRKQSQAAPAKLPAPPREETGKNFKALDDLFSSTTAKPRLYYLPVSADIATKRMEILSRATHNDAEIVPSDDKWRYTFEEDEIVHKGPEFGFGRGGGAAGRGRGGGFTDRGSYRSRGRGGFRDDHRGGYRSGAGIGYRERW